MIYNIFHQFQCDGGFGDAVWQNDLIATVDATKEEIDAFVKEWHHPRIYERAYDAMVEHIISASPVTLMKLSDVVPYNPDEKDMPSLPEKPEDAPRFSSWYWDKEAKEYILLTREERVKRGINEWWDDDDE